MGNPASIHPVRDAENDSINPVKQPFGASAKLGVCDYESRIEKYFTADGGAAAQSIFSNKEQVCK